MKSRIYLSSPHMGGAELKYIHEAFDQNWIAPLGPNVDAFEQALARYCGVKHAAALSSGTAAIHLALILLDVKPGDYVIGSSFTFSASVNPIAYQGAVPVLVDSEADTWNMDPELLEQAIKGLRTKGTDYSTAKPKAIIVTHLYGMPARMKEITKIANKYDIPVIEDAAEALGSEYMGKRVGCNGKFGILSFNGNKIITTSGGGALLSDDEALIKRARFLATQARDPAPHYQHSVIGYNYRMSNIVAGIGCGQMEVLDERIRQRRAVNIWYRELLEDVPGVTFHTEPSKDFFSNYWLTCIVIDPSKSGTNREKLRLAFEAENIEARPLWKPMHLQPVFAEAPAFVNETSQRLFENGLCLPSGSNLTDIELARISEVLKRQFRI
jgi:dTDP-4-amino-4,6-dideoxygalactose transaminase